MKTIKISVKEGELINIDKYPNFHKTGSIKGMKKLYYGENAYLIKCRNYIYNVPKEIYEKQKNKTKWNKKQ